MLYCDLAIFTRVAEHLSFTEAARVLSLPASRVSRRVAALEEHLGQRLFDRTTRSVRLTLEGRALLDRCGAAVESLDFALATGTRPDPGGHIRLTAPPLAARKTIGPKLLDFMAQRPDVSIEMMATNAMLDFIRDGLDLAFRLDPIPDSALIRRPLWQVSYGLYAAPDLLTRHGLTATMDRATFDKLPKIVTRQTWLFDGCERAPRNIAHRIDELELAAAAVRRGLGVGLMPCGMLDEGLVRLSVEGLAPAPRMMNAVYPSRRFLPQRIRDLIDWMTA